MKIAANFFTVLTIIVISLSLNLARAQDDAPPPPPDMSADPGSAQYDQSQDDQPQGDQDQGTSFQTFYDQLGSQGTWVQTDDYGYVFQPNVTDPNWAPYTDGHWVYTDVGWTWVSDEPWGWATYHYGRWANIDGFGWAWVPGYRWAPAWVSWRYGGGYAGWAPLPPESFVGAEYGGDGGSAGFHFGGDVDVSFGIGAGAYNFLSIGDMGERNYRGHYLDRGRNYTVINVTRNITNININNRGTGFNGVVANGPQLADVNAHSRQHIATVQLTAQNQPGRSNVQGNSLAVYAPRMNPASVHQARPASVARTIDHPTFNRGTSIAKPLAVNASLKPAAPSAETIAAARTAQLHAPATARIATAKTVVKTPLTKPLTSMAPVDSVRHTANGAPSAIAPNVQHPAASAPFTGESVKPATAQPQPNDAQAEQEARRKQQAQAGQLKQQQAQSQQRQQQQTQNQDEARQQQAQVEQQRQQQTQAQDEARQRQQAQAEQEARQRQAQVEQQTHQQQAQVEQHQPQQAPAEISHPQPQVTHEAPPPQVHPQTAPAPASHPAPAPSGGGNKPAAVAPTKPQGQ